MAETISLSSIILILVLGYLAFRFFSSPATSAAGRQNGGRQIDVAKVEQVASMFPQLDRRTIAWDLLRNGGNVGATAEKVLTGGALETVGGLLFCWWGGYTVLESFECRN